VTGPDDQLSTEPPGDVLVFLSGEREIRDTAEAIRHLENTEVLPGYARLPIAEQQRVFQPSRTRRRIMLATNVAETSLTVPGIRYVPARPPTVSAMSACGCNNSAPRVR
jgi:ATP-dependent helicase HrpA